MHFHLVNCLILDDYIEILIRGAITILKLQLLFLKLSGSVAQWKNVRLEIEGSLVRGTPEALGCVLRRTLYPLLSTA